MTAPFLGLAPDVVPTPIERFAYTARHRPLVHAAAVSAIIPVVGVPVALVAGTPVLINVVLITAGTALFFLIGWLTHSSGYPRDSPMHTLTPRDHAAVLRTIWAVRRGRPTQLHPRLREVALGEVQRRRMGRLRPGLQLGLAALQLGNGLLQWSLRPGWAIMLFVLAALLAGAGGWELIAQRRMTRAADLTAASPTIHQRGGPDVGP